MAFRSPGFWVALLATVSSLGEALQITGTTAYLNGIPYWIAPDAIGSLQSNLATLLFESNRVALNGFMPMSAVSSGSDAYSDASLERELSHFGENDDVWSEGFAKLVYLQATDERRGNSGADSMQSWGNKTVLFAPKKMNEIIPRGPYFLSSQGNIHRAYRLYSDHQEAFTESVYTNSSGKHSVLPAHIPGNSLTIAVPSRLYYKRTPTAPLAGMRVGIKDIFDVTGLKTGNGNRAWYNLYPPANATAPVVKRLLDAGAIIVGKQKTAQFANGEYSTSDWVDYHSPFNPRGDGYQDPSFSSAGAGASVASYDWLDFALGSDTGGSIRGPARSNGLYGLRPSHGAAPLQLALPLAPELDTAGLIARDPLLLQYASTEIYGLPRNSFQGFLPTQLLVESFPAELSNKIATIIDRFLDEMKNVLGIEKTDWFNVTTAWQQSRPQSAPVDIQSLLGNVYATIIGQRQTELVRDPFYVKYASTHDGRLPAVNPVPLARWAFGDAQPSTALADALTNKTVFMDWFQNHVLKQDRRSCTSAVLAYISAPIIQYRSTYRSPPKAPSGFTNQYFSVMAEVPDITIPIGEMSYHSTTTNHTEPLPVSINLMVAKGCDATLLNLVTKLYHAGVLKASEVGASLVDGGEILQKR
ncbi:hypothetical protein COCC4DRAFT_57421 [Bipolaris maydis ATCC 48331]|uniref:Uncharacterized protein n=2 Tax=Cochliobolus heterostrophus TaxID=5016 RepID=M2TZ27_COCH5|nr:uncharacterized protein COCC4DRAFT_57421 [Bipolaris maydis ATCC 48331]EMD91554.1 hypothetical protein COCHEDRAFT_1101831 [Bipolaris maydis C5]KAJ5027278.1 amidase signature domain-containing protein [Bipolaris maydis]ENI08688.1 hypothetical protein COCC4DRAFT_57421 [Bipolaris maydis ATCC 48331]KAJ5058948.1 glutamyl-tRNA amidotransferase [Bipolaris maydis]KAJ6202537.1 glutamyl-tRNA amidotransferase [Bipolaris maydis]